ncbi:MAG TPA: response regulator transcription factor [Stellaceae bacterium]|jgi:DNA-binding NarL/FixJ family response regulator|nr:response regulator transcription factor [Stellaceae bacterium]
MPNIAIFALESVRRGALETIARANGVLVDSAGDVVALQRLLDRRSIAVAVADGLNAEDLSTLGDHAARLIVLADESDAADLVLAGAAAVLPRESSAETLGAAIALAGQGLRLLPDLTLRALAGVEAPSAPRDPDEVPALTPREREVLAAMADGASNKVIARRLGISFHTAKFHVASILTKLDADTRTEALARAARMGMVML